MHVKGVLLLALLLAVGSSCPRQCTSSMPATIGGPPMFAPSMLQQLAAHTVLCVDQCLLRRCCPNPCLYRNQKFPNGEDGSGSIGHFNLSELCFIVCTDPSHLPPTKNKQR